MKKQLWFIGTILCLLLVTAGLYLFQKFHRTESTLLYRVTEKNLLSPVSLSVIPEKTENKQTAEPEKSTPSASPSISDITPAPSESKESGIYSFLQGPKSWGSKKIWSGKWGVTFYDGAKFGAFGCGLCCMANLYSSLSPYECSPIDAYQFAKKNTGYRGGGAIDWGYMKDSLEMMGLSCKLQKKPKTYQAFQDMIEADIGTITLISSNESTCYWTDNPGHYVTVFLYDRKKDKVFLADSGVPEHNRKWISLKLIYKSLKTASKWQLLSITDYKEQNDTLKQKSAGGDWIRE